MYLFKIHRSSCLIRVNHTCADSPVNDLLLFFLFCFQVKQMNSHGLDGFNQDIRKCEGRYSICDRHCRLLSGSGFACNSTGTLETSSFGDN